MQQKDFAVFDCDAHVVEPAETWDYVAAADRDLVRQYYWEDADSAPFGILNGRRTAFVTPGYRTAGMGGSVRGPGLSPAVQRVLYSRNLTPEQWDYMDHRGARDPLARVVDMDLMGIDQVLVIPTMVNNYLYFIENAHAARAVARAVNDWIYDYCQAVPGRMFPCAVLPVQYPAFAVEEARRVAEKGFRVVALRPIDAQGLYPNQTAFDGLWSTIEALGLVVGMHTFPAGETILAGNRDGRQYSPGELVWLQGSTTDDHMVTSQTASFIYEAMAWVAYATLSGFLDQYPNLRMTVFESNAGWLPAVLEQCDHAYRLYRNLRQHKGSRLPSEAFLQQCKISFEADEGAVFSMHEYFGDVAIWASDVYHHDAADAWEVIRKMDKAGVPYETKVKMLSTNACQLYGIEPRLFVTEEAELNLPDWFPTPAEVEAARAPEHVLLANVPPGSFASLQAQLLQGLFLGVEGEVH